MPWLTNHTFKNDRKVRRAAILAAFGGGLDVVSHYVALYGVWAYIRKYQSSMTGYLAWKELIDASVLTGEPIQVSNPLYNAKVIHNQTMRGKDSVSRDKTFDNAKSVRGVNGFLKNFNTQLPKGVTKVLVTGTVGMDSHYLDPFFNHQYVNQCLQAGFQRGNSIGDGSFVPDKRFLAGALDSSPEGRYAYARFYAFCKSSGFDTDMIGVVDIGDVDKPNSMKKQETFTGWQPGLQPTF